MLISNYIQKLVLKKTSFQLPKNITDLEQLEKLIFENVDVFVKINNSDSFLEEIFHKIQIWSGNCGRMFYSKPTSNGDFQIIASNYRTIVEECLQLDIGFVSDSFTELNYKLNRLVNLVKKNKMVNLGTTAISMHIRFWSHYNLRENALPLYDNTMAFYYTKKVLPRDNFLVNYWIKIINDCRNNNMKLLEYESYLLNQYKNLATSLR